MVSFRYHVVSIVAVFLAIALGILFGTTRVNPAVVSDLERRTEEAVAAADDFREQVQELAAEVEQWESFGRSALPLLVDDELPGRPVVLITLQDADVAEVDGVRRTLEQSGATLIGVLLATPKLALAAEETRDELAALLGVSPSTTTSGLSAMAADRLGARLTTSPPVEGESDVLADLLQARFLTLQAGRVDGIGGPGSGFVLLAAGEEEPTPTPDGFLAPLAGSLARRAQPVVVAETTRSAAPFVIPVRDDPSLDGRVATVDNADTVVGRAALVLALHDLWLIPGVAGDYGVKDGASSLLPPP